MLNEMKAHTSNVASASFSPDAKKILTSSYDSVAFVWNVSTGKLLFTLKGYESSTIYSAFSPDGKRMLTMPFSDTVKIWDSETGFLVRSLADEEGIGFESACFSPDGKRVATSLEIITDEGRYSIFKIWDVESGKLITTSTEANNGISDLQFSPDGTKVITATYNPTGQIWDAITGKPLMELKGHTGYLHTAEYSPDGKTIITASQDGTCKVWDAISGALKYTFFALDTSDYLVVDAGYPVLDRKSVV